MEVVQAAEFIGFPVLFVEGGVKEVDPFLPAFDFRAIEALALKFFGDLFPFLGAELRVKLGKKFGFLKSRLYYLGCPLCFLFAPFHEYNKYNPKKWENFKLKSDYIPHFFLLYLQVAQQGLPSFCPLSSWGTTFLAFTYTSAIPQGPPPAFKSSPCRF